MNEICAWYEISREQREVEISRGEGENGTKGYERIGCYDSCDGTDTTCDFFMYEKELRRVMYK